MPLVHLEMRLWVQRHQRVAGPAGPTAQGHLLCHRAGREVDRRGLSQQRRDPLLEPAHRTIAISVPHGVQVRRRVPQGAQLLAHRRRTHAGQTSLAPARNPK